jgi:hypothetical protein
MTSFIFLNFVLILTNILSKILLNFNKIDKSTLNTLKKDFNLLNILLDIRGYPTLSKDFLPVISNKNGNACTEQKNKVGCYQKEVHSKLDLNFSEIVSLVDLTSLK